MLPGSGHAAPAAACVAALVGGGVARMWHDASAACSICSASANLPWYEKDVARLLAVVSELGCSAPSMRYGTPKHLALEPLSIGVFALV